VTVLKLSLGQWLRAVRYITTKNANGFWYYISEKRFLRINYATFHTATIDPSLNEIPTGKNNTSNNTNAHIIQK